MVSQLENLHAFALVVFAHERELAGREAVDVVRVDFIAVPVPLRDDRRARARDEDADKRAADTSEPLAVKADGDGRSLYKVRSLLHSLPGWKWVGQGPSRMVPPSVVRSISGMKMTTGSVVRSLSLTDAAFGMPHTFLANSITASCMPK